MSNIKTELRLEQEGVADQVRVVVKNGVVDLEYYNAGVLKLEIRKFTQEQLTALGELLIKVGKL